MRIWTRRRPKEKAEAVGKYSHAEAYNLMYYICEACQYEERIWNARDGVTPFITRCPECGGHMKHDDWKRDTLAPGHVPEIGQRIFVNMPYELAVVVARLRLKSWEGTHHEPPPPGPERQKLEDSLAEQVYNKGDGPWLIRIE